MWGNDDISQGTLTLQSERLESLGVLTRRNVAKKEKKEKKEKKKYDV